MAGASNAASGDQVYAPGMIMSVYGESMGGFAQAAGAIPLPSYLAGFMAWINGVPAPLYYVSPNQVNIQIPYETLPGLTTLETREPVRERVVYLYRNECRPRHLHVPGPDGEPVAQRRARSGGDAVPHGRRAGEPEPRDRGDAVVPHRDRESAEAAQCGVGDRGRAAARR